MRDPRFDEFLETLNFSFAERLMDFCIKNCTLSRWEDFERYKMSYVLPLVLPISTEQKSVLRKIMLSVFLRMDAGADVA